MPSVELSKPSALGTPRLTAAGERAPIEARSPVGSAASTAAAASPAGVSLEVTAANAPPAPPIDAERVAEIRNALRKGSYPLLPAKIADAMIAAQVSLALPRQD